MPEAVLDVAVEMVQDRHVSTVVDLVATYIHGPFVEGAVVHRDRLRLFSSLERAEEWLRAHLADPFEVGPERAREIRAIRYTAVVGETDGPWQPQCIKYDAQGKVFDDSRTSSDPWPGRPPETCAFSLGDRVLCAHEGRLTAGVVKRRPLAPGSCETMERSDDTYLVVLPDGHEHPHECQMWLAEADVGLDAAAGQ